jgi:hypothetical protein
MMVSSKLRYSNIELIEDSTQFINRHCSYPIPTKPEIPRTPDTAHVNKENSLLLVGGSVNDFLTITRWLKQQK